MKKSLVLVGLSVAILAGCAKRPDAIAPATIPIQAYSNLSCGQLAQTYSSERQMLTALSASQNSAANGDALGVFLIGVPTSSLTGGDQEGNIAVSKGKVQAIEAAMMSKNCPISIAPVAGPVKTKSVTANM